MKIKTSELIGPALDWAVAECEGFFEAKSENGLNVAKLANGWVWVARHPKSWRTSDYTTFKPSTDWAQSGPIIEREVITLGDPNHLDDYGSKEKFLAVKGFEEDIGGEVFGRGPTYLIAAMRCYVASKLGDEVEVPEELI